MERRHHSTHNPSRQLPVNWPYGEYKPSRFERSVRFLFRHRALALSSTLALVSGALILSAQNQHDTGSSAELPAQVQESIDQERSERVIQPAQATAQIEERLSPKRTLEGAVVASGVAAFGVGATAIWLVKNQYAGTKNT